jgi:hypothetical protein
VLKQLKETHKTEEAKTNEFIMTKIAEYREEFQEKVNIVKADYAEVLYQI